MKSIQLLIVGLLSVFLLGSCSTNGTSHYHHVEGHEEHDVDHDMVSLTFQQ